jgi:hypothetical protein
MSRLTKRFGGEIAWLVGALAVGAFLWILVVTGYDERTDAFMTANGHRPPLGTFWSPDRWMPAFLLGPYIASLLVRLLNGARRPSQLRA